MPVRFRPYLHSSSTPKGEIMDRGWYTSDPETESWTSDLTQTEEEEEHARYTRMWGENPAERRRLSSRLRGRAKEEVLKLVNNDMVKERAEKKNMTPWNYVIEEMAAGRLPQLRSEVGVDEDSCCSCLFRGGQKRKSRKIKSRKRKSRKRKSRKRKSRKRTFRKRKSRKRSY